MWEKVVSGKWKILLVVDLVAVNLFVFFLYQRVLGGGITGELVSGQSQLAKRDDCGPECRAYIDQRVALISIPGATSATGISLKATPSSKPVASPAPTVKQKVRQVQYFSILGSGQTTSNDWAGLSGTEFYFDRGNYSGLIDISFEGNLRLLNGNGSVYVRIFDVTHSIAVQGSEIFATSQTSTVISSGSLAFWAGNNLYRVQAKSLTADTAVFNSGRLKITSEN